MIPPNLTAQEVIVTENRDWYRPGKSLREFHNSPAYMRFLVGGRGSGKTTSVAMEVIKHSLHNPGAKILGLRKTEISQMDTTIDTFNQVYRNLGDLYIETPTSLFRSWRNGLTVRLPSLEAADRYNHFFRRNPSKAEIDYWLDPYKGEASRWCAWLEFRGVPDAAKSGNKLRGYECSMAVLIEADLMTREDFDLTVPTLRVKNSHGMFIKDGGIIVDTNPPSPRHWIAEIEKEEKDNPKFQFLHIPTEENRDNLPPEYVENLKRTYAKNPAMYKRMVLGEYAEAFDGNPVFYAFDHDTHSFEDLPFPQGAYLVRSWDFGTTHAVIWSAYWNYENQEYWWCLGEYYAEGSDTDRQCRRVLEITATQFPFWNDREKCAGVLDYIDPAGTAKKDTGSSVDILSTYNIFPGFRTKHRDLKKTIAICNRLLEAKDQFDKNIFRIDRKNCPRLYTAMLGGYRYPKVGEAGYGSDEPMKGSAGGDYDHVADAWRYGVINTMRLAKMETESVREPVGALKRKFSVNPLKRWY